MRYRFLEIFARLARFGVLSRDSVKNDLPTLNVLLQKNFVRKVYRQGRVFYELTSFAVPLLEHHRRKLLEEVNMRTMMEKRTAAYASLLEDVRFLDENHEAASAFVFLGDWQLHRPVVPAQLELAKLRFYAYHVSKRERKAA